MEALSEPMNSMEAPQEAHQEQPVVEQHPTQEQEQVQDQQAQEQQQTQAEGLAQQQQIPQQSQQNFAPSGYDAASMNPAPSAMAFGATHLLAACESCLVVTRVPGVDMSFRRIMERKCPRCGGTLVLPQEVMEMLILYGNFVPESVAVMLVLGTMVLHPSLRADFMAAAMNDLLTPLQTDFVYDVAVPKRPEGLGMSLRMNQGNLVVGGFIDFENNQESPSVAARIIAVDDILVAINKKSITSWTFEKSISMLAHAASPVYLTFRRRQPVMLL
ncbi:PDZ domain [Phytophthora cactorum]|nr:PDZ domain [Phytophthora cactorum]